MHGPRGMGEVIPCHFVCGLADLICCSCACRELASCEGIYHGRYADSKPSKSHGLAVNVPFVCKESFIFRCFPSLLLPPFLGNDHGALTSAFVLIEIPRFICLVTFFFLSLVFENAVLIFFLCFAKVCFALPHSY